MKTLFLISLLTLVAVLTIHAKPYYTTQNVNIRAGAGTNYEVVDLIKKGTTLEILEVDGSWGKINYRNQVCYINMQFLAEASQPTYNGGNYFNPWPAIILLLIIVVAVVRFFKRIFARIGRFFGFKRKPYKSKSLTPNYQSTGSSDTGEEDRRAREAQRELAARLAAKAAKDYEDQIRREREAQEILDRQYAEEKARAERERYLRENPL